METQNQLEETCLLSRIWLQAVVIATVSVQYDHKGSDSPQTLLSHFYGFSCSNSKARCQCNLYKRNAKLKQKTSFSKWQRGWFKTVSKKKKAIELKKVTFNYVDHTRMWNMLSIKSMLDDLIILPGHLNMVRTIKLNSEKQWFRNGKEGW